MEVTSNYIKISMVIEHINKHQKTQPSLNELAHLLELSPLNFERLFINWVGISPKQFLHFTTLHYTKEQLKNNKLTLFDTAHQIELSNTRRFHNLFVKIEVMTPVEYQDFGKKLVIDYSYFNSPFGLIILGSTSKGLCFMQFAKSKEIGFNILSDYFSNAQLNLNETKYHQIATSIYTNDRNNISELKLHLKGTDFQLKVWETLLKIPHGSLTTYGAIANFIDKPKASRAVGTVIGKNPIALIIPCHRVIQSTGKLGGYMWGTIRKKAIIGWEEAMINKEI